MISITSEGEFVKGVFNVILIYKFVQKKNQKQDKILLPTKTNTVFQY